jgi:Uma2 family endonuclease
MSTTKMNAWQFLMLGEDPPGVRLELVDGEIAVGPSATLVHSFAVVQMIAVLGWHIESIDLGELYHDVSTILYRFNVRRPDVLYFAKSRVDLIGEKAMEGPPDLAVEVISPSSVEIDRKDKFEQYRKAGVRHYWIVDPGLKTLEAWTLKGRKYVPVARGQGAAVMRVPPFEELEIPLGRLWRRK